MHRKYAGIKSAFFSDLPPVVVELGPGTGANFRYLPMATHLIAIEPNRQMHAALRRRAKKFSIDLELRELAAEALDLQSGSVDFLFTTLVLCSVKNPQKVLAEVLRVLRPGGRFVCLEHVAAPPGSPERAVQQAIARPWRWLFEGCHLCRNTGALLNETGFGKVDIQHLVLATSLLPIRYQIVAVCVK